MYTRLLSFIEKHGIFNTYKFSFQPSLNFVDAVKELTEETRTVMESKVSGHLYLLDLKKSFDTKDLQILFNKLERFSW